jgi:hypothetical protein
MNIALWFFIGLGALVVSILVGMGIGRFLKRNDERASCAIEQERRRRFWERNKCG